MSVQQSRETKYFVRSSTDATEKGPYDRHSLRRSLDHGLLQPDAGARAEGSEKWVSLESLFKEENDAKDARHQEAEYVRSLAKRETARDAERTASGANIILGLVLVGAGLGLTVISVQGGGRIGMVFVGLIVVGAIRMIRGFAAR